MRWAAIAATIAVGYAVRFHGPVAWRDPAGGAAYVVLAALLASFRLRPLAAAASALTFTCLVESLQLWHAPVIDALRATLPGRLVLGTTFSWNDFPPYLAGAALGFAVVRALAR